MATHSSILAWRIHGQRSLAGYSPWGRKESDMTEHRVDWGPFCHEPGRTVSVSIRALQRSRGNTPTGTRSAQSLQLRPTLCDHVDCSPPGSSVMGSSRQEHWSGLPCPPPRDLPHPGIEPVSLLSPVLAGGPLTTSGYRD